jgi:TonB family protein
MKNRKKTFIQVPQIIGGNEAFKKYVEQNLVYPAEAREKRIEGTVQLIAEIDDNGKVAHVEILHGIGGGCNEEAIRLIRNVSFGAVKNKGIRLKTKKRFCIKFQLPPESIINYQVISKPKEAKQDGQEKKFSYSILLK